MSAFFSSEFDWKLRDAGCKLIERENARQAKIKKIALSYPRR